MARTKGMLNLSGNLEVNAGAPLDARSVVPTVADLTVASNFQYKYVGMPVVVQATGDMYVLTDNDVTVAANWKPVGKTYTAGTNVNISDQNVISATDTTYTAGTGIDIENDEISTDNMPAADMAEIVTPLPSVMSRLPRYSTEEQIVGYWIDGKPLYQKTIVKTTDLSSPFAIADNIDRVLSYEAIRHNTDGYDSPFPYPPDTTTTYNNYVLSGFYDEVNSVWRPQVGSSVSTNKDIYTYTFRYTKTTD